MNSLLSIFENDDNFRIFDQLTVEIHIWKIIRNRSQQIETWELVYANPPTLKTWARKSLSEIKGKLTDEIFGPGATEHYMPIIQKIMAENAPYSFQDYFENLNKHFRFTSIPLGEYFITTGDDITEFVEEVELIRDENQALDRLVKQRTAKLENSEEEIRLLNIIEKEKEKIYLATIHGAQHIINNLLNELKLVELEIENHPKFDKEVSSMFGDMITEATSLIYDLSTVDKVDDKIIRQSVSPRKNTK